MNHGCFDLWAFMLQASGPPWRSPAGPWAVPRRFGRSRWAARCPEKGNPYLRKNQSGREKVQRGRQCARYSGNTLGGQSAPQEDLGLDLSPAAHRGGPFAIGFPAALPPRIRANICSHYSPLGLGVKLLFPDRPLLHAKVLAGEILPIGRVMIEADFSIFLLDRRFL